MTAERINRDKKEETGEDIEKLLVGGAEMFAPAAWVGRLVMRNNLLLNIAI
jgi:hypothetical protein